MFHSVFCWAWPHSSVCDQNVWIFILRVVWCYGHGTITMLPFTSAGPDPYLFSTENLSVTIRKYFTANLLSSLVCWEGWKQSSIRSFTLFCRKVGVTPCGAVFFSSSKINLNFFKLIQKLLSMEKIRIHPSMHS